MSSLIILVKEGRHGRCSSADRAPGAGQAENRRTYLHELVFGDPTEPHRCEGLTLAAHLEDGFTNLLARDERILPEDAASTMAQATATRGYALLAANSRTDAETERQNTLNLVSRQVDAIILATVLSPSEVAAMPVHGIPRVLIDQSSSVHGIPGQYRL